MMELGATVCGARTAACDACPAAPWCASRGTVRPQPRRAPGSAVRFEDTNRWVRGRVVAALASGEGVPPGIPAERLGPALAGLVRMVFSDYRRLRQQTGLRRYSEVDMLARLQAAGFGAKRLPTNVGHNPARMPLSAISALIFSSASALRLFSEW